MTGTTRTVLVTFLLALCASEGAAQDRLRYRTYALGDDMASVSLQTGLTLSAHDRPTAPDAVRELRWQARYVRRGTAPEGDPVRRLIFSFYGDRLFRIVVDYASDRTAGMTEGDMVGAVSKIFGPPTRRVDTPAAPGTVDGRPPAGVVAQWIDGDQSVALLTLQDGTTFRMIVSSARIEALALVAGADSVPTDVPDWTSIGASRARTAASDEVTAQERTRRTNAAAFIP